jgi:hypothetical protein
VQGPPNSFTRERFDVAGGIPCPKNPIACGIHYWCPVGERRGGSKQCCFNVGPLNEMKPLPSGFVEEVDNRLCWRSGSGNCCRDQRSSEVNAAILQSHQPAVARSAHGHR